MHAVPTDSPVFATEDNASKRVILTRGYGETRVHSNISILFICMVRSDIAPLGATEQLRLSPIPLFGRTSSALAERSSKTSASAGSTAMLRARKLQPSPLGRPLVHNPRRREPIPERQTPQAVDVPMAVEIRLRATEASVAVEVVEGIMPRQAVTAASTAWTAGLWAARGTRMILQAP